MSKKLKRIFLIRHGNSEANKDFSYSKRVPDHAVPLTEEGEQQAQTAGRKLSAYWNAHPEVKNQIFRLWNSPYKRTRQTRDGILTGLEKNRSVIRDVREHIALSEQNFGLFDGLTDAEQQENFPEYRVKYELCKKFQGRFWSKPPNGESRYDVCIRISQIFGTLMRDAEKKENPVQNVVIVSHGTTIRAFIMQFLHKDFEWFEAEPNPHNCSIRLIKENEHGYYEDCGYLFDGFPDQEAIRKMTAEIQSPKE